MRYIASYVLDPSCFDACDAETPEKAAIAFAKADNPSEWPDEYGFGDDLPTFVDVAIRDHGSYRVVYSDEPIRDEELVRKPDGFIPGSAFARWYRASKI